MTAIWNRALWALTNRSATIPANGARIWVGDHGRWKTGLTGSARNEAFRDAPHFDARARFETERSVLDRLLALYEEKYAGEFGRWREEMRTGFYAGHRLLIRYEPV